MNLRKWILIGGLSLSTLAQAAEETFTRITRATGGEPVIHALSEKALQATVDLSAINYKILVRQISYKTQSGIFKSVSLSKVAASNSQSVADERGIFILPNSLPLRLNISDADAAVAVNIQAESFGGYASLKVASYITQSAGPVLPPIVDQPNNPLPADPGVDYESQCAKDLVAANDSYSACSQSSQTESAINGVRLDQFDQVNLQYQSALRPLQSCQASLSKWSDYKKDLDSQLSSAKSGLSGAQYQVQQTRNQINEGKKELQGGQYTCTVRGRHQSFVANAATKAEALMKALASCGLNNCGKKDWNSNNWSCEIH
jgi:hypothetical protein